MAISKLNAVFARHHRIFFGFLMVLIILSFLIFTGPGESPFSCVSSANCGTVYGRDLTVSDLTGQIRFNELVYGGAANDAQRFMMAYEVLSYAAAARERGFNVSDGQLSKQIAAMPIFMDNGKFSIDVYKQELAARGLSTQAFESALKNFILMQKLNNANIAGIIVSDDEIRNFYDYMYETFTVSSKTFNNADYINGLSISADEAAAWFNDRAANGAPYMLPNRYEAAAIIIDSNSPVYAKQVNIDPAKMEEYIQARYEANKARFTAADGTVKPISEVKTELFKEIMAAEAAKYACAELEEFINDTEPLLHDPETRLEELTRAAVKKGYTVTVTDTFKENDIPAVLADVPYLAAAATKRTMSSPVTPSAVNGTKAGIAVLLKHIPAAPAELTDVQTQVEADCLADKARKEAQKAAEAEYIRLEALDTDARIALCAGADSGYRSDDIPRSILLRIPQGAMIADAETGTVIAPSENYEGSVIYVVTGRKLPAAEDFDLTKGQYEYELFNLKHSSIMQAIGEDMAMKGCIAPQIME